MSFIPRQAARHVKALHTTSRLLADTPTSSPPTGKSLGFGDYSGRTRKLPTIEIPATSRMNPLKQRSQQPRSDSNSNPSSRPRQARKPEGQVQSQQNGSRPPRERNQAQGQGQGARKFPEERNKRQSRSPLAAATKTHAESDSSAPAAAEGDEFFTSDAELGFRPKSKPKSNLAAVDVAFDSESVSLPMAKTRNRGNRNATGSSSSSSVRKGPGAGAGAATKEKRKSVQAPVLRQADDRSAEGIFGRSSLLFPIRRGAREAERSIWAEGMKSEDGTST